MPIPRRLYWTKPAAPGGLGAPGSSVAAAPESVTSARDARVDAAFALTRREVDALVRVADERTGVSQSWPATPDRVRSAIEAALAVDAVQGADAARGDDAAAGSVVVTRLPRALHSAETWHVRLVAVPAAGRDRVAATIGAARLAGRSPSEAERDVL